MNSWEKLHDGKTYKIYESGGDWVERWIMGIRYRIADPDGGLLGYAWTIRGARRKIARHRPAPELKWWDRPIVAEVERGPQ